MSQIQKIKLERKEFIYWANWIAMRWPNAKIDQTQIKVYIMTFQFIQIIY